MLKHWIAWVTGSALAAAVAIGGGAFGWGLSSWLYAGLFIWLGVLVAGFQAWVSLHAAFESQRRRLQADWEGEKARLQNALETERGKSLRREREAEAKRRPKLSIVFDEKNQQCVRWSSGAEIFSVGIQNDGDVQADGVRLVLEDIFPSRPELLNQHFAKDKVDEFRVSPTPGRPALYVDILQQSQHAIHGFLQTVLLQRSKQIKPGTSKLILTLRLHAVEETEPFILEFNPDHRGSLRPKVVKPQAAT